MKRILLLAVLAAVGWLPGSAHARQVGLSVSVGTLGPGASVAYSVSPKFSVRAGGSLLSTTINEDFDEDDVSLVLEGDARVGAVSALADYHPFRSSFRLTGGLRLNLLDGDVSGRSADPFCLGDEDAQGVCQTKEFAPEKVGTFGVKVSYANALQPYAGIGFGNLAHGRKRITFMFDAGLIYTGSPDIELVATGLLTPTAEQNEAVLNEGFESFVVYPVISFGIGVRFR